MPTRTSAASLLFQLLFVPSCCGLSVPFQEIVVDTLQHLDFFSFCLCPLVVDSASLSKRLLLTLYSPCVYLDCC